MRVCIIGDSKVESDLALLESAKKKFDDVLFVPVDGIRMSLDNTGEVFYRSTNIGKFDIIIPRILSKESFFAYQFLHILPPEKFLAIRPVSYLIVSNRFFMFNYLRQEGIPTHDIDMAKSPSAGERILEKAKFPITLRIPEAETVMIANTKNEAKTFIDTLERLEKPILIEKKLPKTIYRLLVAGSSVIQTTSKVVESGDPIYGKGRIALFKANSKMKELAVKTCQILNTDIARVDIANDNGSLVVVNVVLKPSFTEIKSETKTIVSKVLDLLVAEHAKSKDRPPFVRLFEGIKSSVREVFDKK